jgi:hypothetical protein
LRNILLVNIIELKSRIPHDFYHILPAVGLHHIYMSKYISNRSVEVIVVVRVKRVINGR